ncbi:MAG: hypothetical protein Ct9H90mP2_03830 [Dehalococcoidia bacterium]|nr:MAG: hypothetical protein Ct9H90mP2_03830 [Dehalococcoidia bacterium]
MGACESELVAIIGKVTKNVSEEEALDYVFGYTCGNDVSAREWQGGDELITNGGELSLLILLDL